MKKKQAKISKLIAESFDIQLAGRNPYTRNKGADYTSTPLFASVAEEKQTKLF